MYKIGFVFIIVGMLLFSGCPVDKSIEIDSDDEKGEDSLDVENSRTISEIRDVWEYLKPTFSGDKYETEPSYSAPYKAGSLKQGFLEDGLNMANFVRYLSGLPYDLTLDDSYNSEAQHGAVLLAVSNFSHYPEQPSDMSDEFYEIARGATSSSNIAYGYYTLAYSIQRGYMSDSDTGNMAKVGHRRWILNPPMKKLGFGYAISSSAMKVFDRSREEEVDYEYITWPAEGNFPTEFFYTNDPWSISLNPDNYNSPSSDSVKVVLESINDNHSWTLDQNDNSISTNEEYFNINNQGYGVKYCIIFRPSGSVSYNSGDKYTVTISGLVDFEGAECSISYNVNFFNIEEDSSESYLSKRGRRVL